MSESNTKYLVSIVLTTYNRANVLKKTIDSILAQTYKNFELIISDDCSTDDTAAICMDYELADFRVKYYRNEVNLRMPGNLNAALKRTKGEFVANLHDGDVYKPELIEKWLECVQRDKDILFVFNQYSEVDHNGRLLCVHNHYLEPINSGIVIRKYFFSTLSSAPWGTVMVRRVAYEKYGYFDEQYGFMSDVDMWLRLSTKGKVGYVSEPLIELTPREKNHKYFLPDATILFQNYQILYNYFIMEKECVEISEKYVSKKIKKDLKRKVITLIRNLSISRLRHFNYLIHKTDYTSLKILFAFIFLLGKTMPKGYNDDTWKLICCKFR